MNAKKKNKKANKPPNPNPQNVESAPKKEEKVEELTPKCEVKEDILQPVCSEVTVMPVSDVKEVDSETPKKPKRNKGKNKKQDKEEKIEAEQKVQEVQVESIIKGENPPETILVDEKKCEEKADLLEDANIVPSARKKKNKKKTQEPLKEETNIIDNIDTKLPSESTTGVIEKVDTEIEELFSSKPETPKLEGKKKKNKKKNRTDSEKSDNILSCTSAFENILVESTPKLEQPDSGVEVKEPIIICELDKDKSEKVISFNETDKKKKNKKKNRNDSEKSDKLDNVLSCTSAFQNILVEDTSKLETPDCEVETKEPITCELDTDKSEHIMTSIEPEKKKKNKKKNRNDSERSDKSDNVKSGASTFQYILAEDNPKLEKPDSDNKVMELTTVLDSNKSEHVSMSDNEPKIVEKVKETNVDAHDVKDFSKSENKSKKKNKKDKKQQQQEIAEAVKHDISLPVQDTLTPTRLLDESNEFKPQIMESVHTFGLQIEKEPSPKPKAKIAKPVDKNRKGKLETESSESRPNIESSEKMSEDVIKDVLFKELEPKIEFTPAAVTILESQVENQTKQQLPSIPSLVENMSVPLDHAMGKKRKKSPKPSTQKEIKPDTSPEKEIKDVFETKEPVQTIIDLQAEIQTVSTVSPETQLKSPDHVHKNLIELENKPLERPLTPEMKTENEGFETKTSKKKKKTPKVPQTEITFEMNKPVIETTKTDDRKPMSDDSAVISEALASIPVEPILTAGAEVQNIATESEVVKCDVVPDVHIVRSSSQCLFDSNNNTVIQEVMNVEESKLNDPQVIPLIEGSGSTPVLTPEPVSFGIRMTGIEMKTPTEEKTDIKSKMMEVNQDMEELRLSIERSLAEFTALEKCKTEPEETPKSSVALSKNKGQIKDHENKEKVIEKVASEVKSNFLEMGELKDLAKTDPAIADEILKLPETPPVCPARKDNKGKNKSKKKGKQESTTAVTTTPAPTTASTESSTTESKDNKKEEQKEKTESKSEQKSSHSQEKGKQQSSAVNDSNDAVISKDTDNEKFPSNLELATDSTDQIDFEPIENFEDALTSSNEDVNRTFEMIAKDAVNDNIEFQKKLAANKPEINITTAEETDRNKNEKVNPISQPKNLLGHTDIPVQSNKTDYKKEKNKTPNARQARVKIKDSMEIESKKQSKESQTENKRSRKIVDKSVKESFSRVTNDTEEYVYKYSFRKVYLQSACHICNRDLSKIRVPCGYCNLIFYCGAKHKDEDWPQHQALCFAVSTLAHMKDQKHIYADAAHTAGQDYRLLRMQMIVSCEKVLKRRLVPWEQEVMLYPRLCADVACREWRQGKLKDCDGCGQLSYCAAHPDHLPKAHSRWCKSYSLYQKLVTYQQTKGRLEPRLPTKVMEEDHIPTKMNEVLAAMYEEKIDMNDIQYAALTQLATAPLTTAYCLQLCRTATGITNGLHKKHPFTIHVVGAELQFEADALSKWETFFLHLRPDVDELRVVLVSPQLNPGNLPLELLGKIKLCNNCQENKRRVVFKFEDNKNYFEYRSSEDFINPDIICAFNPSIQRSSIYNGKDPWPTSINAILKLKTPFVITSYTLNELRKDIARIKQVSELDFKLISEPGFNNFASVRPDRNFISDDEMPLLFKNYCVSVILGC